MTYSKCRLFEYTVLDSDLTMPTSAIRRVSVRRIAGHTNWLSETFRTRGLSAAHQHATMKLSVCKDCGEDQKKVWKLEKIGEKPPKRQPNGEICHGQGIVQECDRVPGAREVSALRRGVEIVGQALWAQRAGSVNS